MDTPAAPLSVPEGARGGGPPRSSPALPGGEVVATSPTSPPPAPPSPPPSTLPPPSVPLKPTAGTPPDSTSPSPSPPPVRLSHDLVAGATAGLAADTLTHPLDTLRTRASLPAPRPPLSVWRLYAGLPAVVAASAPASAIYFATYAAVADALTPRDGEGGDRPGRGGEEGGLGGGRGERGRRDAPPSLPAAAAAGVAAELTAAALWTPAEVLKQRAQAAGCAGVAAGDYASLRAAVATAVAGPTGIRGLWTGYGVGVATYAPFAAVYFSVYEAVRPAATDAAADEDDGKWGPRLAAASTAGGVAAVVTCPLDVLRTRVQVGGEGVAAAVAGLTAAGGWGGEGGRKGAAAAWARACGARVVALAPAAAVGVGVWDWLRRVLVHWW